MAVSKQIKAGIGYTVANVLVRGIGFVTLPIFARLLSPADFGLYNIFMAYEGLLFCFIGFALHSSLRSANIEYPGQIDNYTSSVSVIYLLNLLAMLCLAWVFREQLAALIGVSQAAVYLLVAGSFGGAVIEFYNCRIALQYNYKGYLAVALISSLANVALAILLILTVFDGERYLGRVVAAASVPFAVAAVLLVRFFIKARPSINWTFWKFGFMYSLPIVPHGMSQVVLGQVGRIMIQHMVSIAAAGIYSLAANLMSIVVILVGSVSTVWTTWFYDTLAAPGDIQGKGKTIQARARVLLLGSAFVSIGLMGIAPELVLVLGGEAYREATYSAYGMILCGECVFAYNLICAGEYYKKKTIYIFLGTVLAAALSVIFNFVGIRLFGYIAVAYTTLLAYCCYVVFHWVICRHLMGISVIPLSTSVKIVAVLGIALVADWLLTDRLIVRWLVTVGLLTMVAWPIVRERGGFKTILATVFQFTKNK